MNSDGQRFREGAKLEVDAIREGVESVGGDGDVLGHGAGYERAHEDALRADLVLTGAAVRALPAVPERLYGYAGAHFDAADAIAEGRDFAGVLVAGWDAGGCGKGAVVKVEVGAADAAGADAKQDLAGTGLRILDLSHLDHFLRRIESCFHVARLLRTDKG
jgi:hypothetical protein